MTDSEKRGILQDQSTPRRWSANELYRLLDLGFFQAERVELIEGDIIQRAAQGNFHALSIKLTEDALNAIFRPSYWVLVQMSLDLSPYSVPDPDIAVITGSPRDNTTKKNPTTALLIVEISDSTLAYDRNRKGSLYALMGIADYWIVNLEKGRLEVYRNPVVDQTAFYGYAYKDVEVYAATDEIAPLAMPNALVKVSDLLP